jgi:membrane-bound ClpP family serine protease
MSGLLDQPAVVVLAAAAASIFVLLEIALPTFGLAGAAGIFVGAIGVWAVDRIGADWWPLLGIVAAMALWGVLIAAHRVTIGGHAVALVFFVAGALGYARTASDWPAAITSIATAVVLALVYPRIAVAAERLQRGQPAVGVESFVGETAAVAAWEGTRGQVILAGTRWNASGPDGLHEGDEVVVLAAVGLSLTVGSRDG